MLTPFCSLSLSLFMAVPCRCSDSSLAHCSDLWAGTCLPITDAQLAAYPPMALQLSNGVELHMTAKDYLLLGSPLAGMAKSSPFIELFIVWFIYFV